MMIIVTINYITNDSLVDNANTNTNTNTNTTTTTTTTNTNSNSTTFIIKCKYQ